MYAGVVGLLGDKDIAEGLFAAEVVVLRLVPPRLRLRLTELREELALVVLR